MPEAKGDPSSFQSERLSIARILNHVVDQQQQTAIQFTQIHASLESIRAEIRRTDENQHKEVQGYQDIINKLLAQMKDMTIKAATPPPAAAPPTPHQVYANSASPASFFDPNQQAAIFAAKQQQIQQYHQMVALQAAMQAAPGGLTSGLPQMAQGTPVLPKPATVPLHQVAPSFPQPNQFKPPPQPSVGTVTLPLSTPPKAEVALPKMEPPKVEPKKEPTPSVTSAAGISFKPPQQLAPSIPPFGQSAPKTENTPSTSIFRPIQAQPPAPIAAPTVKDEEDEEDEDDEEYEPNVEFKPVVPLPALVDVKTGEENETVLFKEHCKLYRFYAETKEWKERGTGDLKILKDNKSGTYRVVMRRDQVLKLCANFKLTKGMTVARMGKNTKACCWHCVDFSEEDRLDDGAHEQLSAKFASAEMTDDFMNLFSEGVASSTGSTPTKGEEIHIPKSTETKKEEKKEEPKAFGAQFVKKEGEWDCEGCYTRQPASSEKCACCGTNRDGSKGEKDIFATGTLSKSLASTPGNFSFGCAPDKSKFQFGLSKSATPEPAKTITPEKAPAFSTTTEKPKFSFAAAASAAAKEEAVAPQKSVGFGASATGAPKFSFGVSSPSTGGIFGGAAKTTSDEPAKPTFSFAAKKEEVSSTTPTTAAATASPSQVNFSFKSASPAPGKSIFGQSAQPATPTAPVEKKEEVQPATSATNKIFGSNFSFSGFNKEASGGSIFDSDAKKVAEDALQKQKTTKFGASIKQEESKREDDEENDDEDEEYEPEVDFKPVIPLPDLIEVKTGEENEETLFKERAKLYRYSTETKEWKERGIGEIKVLKNPDNGACRVVMRREQTHKLCANFALMKGMTASKMPKNMKACQWICNDFSEEVLATEQLSAKFGSTETADEFLNIFSDGVQHAQ